MNEDLIRNKFGSYGEILSVVLLAERKCGFVSFGSRESAESVMNACFDCLYLNKRKCQLNWARPKGNKDEEKEKGTEDVVANEKESVKKDELSKEDAQYLKQQGILPPSLPSMPDPCVSNA